MESEILTTILLDEFVRCDYVHEANNMTALVVLNRLDMAPIFTVEETGRLLQNNGHARHLEAVIAIGDSTETVDDSVDSLLVGILRESDIARFISAHGFIELTHSPNKLADLQGTANC